MKRYKKIYLLLGILAVVCAATIGVMQVEEHKEKIKNTGLFLCSQMYGTDWLIQSILSEVFCFGSLLKVTMIGVFPLCYLGIGIYVVLRRRRVQNEAV